MIAQLVERETVVGSSTVISRSAVRLRLAGGVTTFYCQEVTPKFKGDAQKFVQILRVDS